MKDSLLLDAKLPNMFWAEAMLAANKLKNLLPASKRDKVPNHTITGVQPNVAHLRIFGSIAHVHIPKEKRIKSDIKRTWTGIFLGYTESTKKYQIWSPQQRSVHEVSSVTIDESTSGAYLLDEFPLHPIRTKNANRTAPDAPRRRGRPRLEKQTQQNDKEAVESYEPVDTEMTATPALRNQEGSTQSKTMRAEVPKRGRGRPRKVIEEPIIDVAESGEGFQLALIREDAQAGHLANPKSLAHRTVRNNCSPPGLTTADDPYVLDVREIAGLSTYESRATQKSEGYGTQKVSYMQKGTTMSGFQKTRNRVNLLHPMGSVASGNPVRDQLRPIELDIEEVYIPNKRLKLMELKKRALYNKTEEPKTYKEALSDPIHGRGWQDAIQNELESLQSHGVWELDTLPEGRKSIGCKWVFKMKYDENGLIEKYKARLVAQGFSQQEGIDYKETFAPTVQKESLRIFLAIVAAVDLELHQMDVVAAYLVGDLEAEGQEIYMRIPEGADVRQGRMEFVWRIVKSLYGLKQSARLWNKKLVTFWRDQGYKLMLADGSIMVAAYESGFTIVSIYVDDLLIAATSLELVKEAKRVLCKEFDMKDLGEARMIIGMRIIRHRPKRLLTLDQASYIRDVLQEESLLSCNPVSIPMTPGSYIALEDDSDSDPTEITAYQRLIGKLLYIACGTRPDIAFAVGCLSQQCLGPRIGHYRAAKKVLRYLKGTMDLGIHYNGSYSDAEHLLTTLGYSDSNFAGDIRERKSTMGYCFFLVRGVISWCSKKQRTVSTSTTEAEYIAIGHAARQAVWLRRFLIELPMDRPPAFVRILGDNQASLDLVKNAEHHDRTKHIDVQHHYVRELVRDDYVRMEWVPTKEQLADGFTKALPRPTFVEHRTKLGVMPIIHDQRSMRDGRS